MIDKAGLRFRKIKDGTGKEYFDLPENIMQMQEKENEEIKDVTRDEWNAQELADQATNFPSDEITREMLRGDETQGNPDNRDVVGGVESKDTPHGRKETKKGDES